MTRHTQWTPPTSDCPLLWLPSEHSPCRIGIPMSVRACDAWLRPHIDPIQGALQAIMPSMMELALMAQDQAVATCKGDPMDWVTDVDKGMEWLWRHWIGTHFPSHHIIGEEFENAPLSKGPTWFIDPIDGTYHYMSRATRFSMLVACIDDHRILGACVGDARTHAIYTPPSHTPPSHTAHTHPSHTSYTAHTTASRPVPSALSHPCIATEYRDNDPHAQAIHERVLQACQGVGSRIGSVGLSLVDMLHGHHTVFYMPNMNAWDIVAPLCLITRCQTFDCWLRPPHQQHPLLITDTQWAPLLTTLRTQPGHYKVGDVVITPRGVGDWAERIFACIPLSY